MKNILLPTDFSDNSWNAIVYALHFYKDANCNFYLLYVHKLSVIINNDFPYIPNQDIPENGYILAAKKQLKEVLQKISETFPKNRKHNFYTLTDCNFFIESLRKHLEEKKIAVIVMGTKGASGLSRLIIGSNTGDVITKVKCTTLVVPENAKFKKIEEVAFPTDFSMSNDLQVLQPIVEILEEKNSSLRVLNISKKSSGLNIDEQKSKELLEDFFYNYKHSFHVLTNKKIEDAVQCFVEGRDIDLIAMVAKNLNYFQQILFHTRVEEISYHTDVPFLVLHE